MKKKLSVKSYTFLTPRKFIKSKYLDLGSTNAGADAGVHYIRIQKFGKYKYIMIRVWGNSANFITLKIYYFYILNFN